MALDIYTFVEALWIIIPAYAANGFAPFARYIRNTHRIDGGWNFLGKPIFGPGKTWEGLMIGTFFGILIAAVEMLAFPYLPFEISPVTLLVVPMSPFIGFFLGFGAMFGDLIGSFVKRRVNIERGKSAPILDQDDFVVGAFLLLWLMQPLKWEWLVWMLFFTPMLHVTASFIAFRLGIKKDAF